MKFLVILFFLLPFVVQGGEVSADSTVNKKVTKVFAKHFKQTIYKNTLALAKQSPSSFAAKFKHKEDKVLYQKILTKTKMNHFPTPVFAQGEWRIRVGNRFLVHYSYEDVAKGVIWVNKHKFKLRHYAKYHQLVDHFRYFVKTHFSKKQNVTLMDWFIPSAQAGMFSAELEDILLISISGYISINYDEADIIHGDDDYAKILVDTMAKEMKQASAECEANKQVLNESSGALTESVKEIYDSLKRDDEIDEEKIIAAVLIKHSKNSDDIFFHKDFREEHPECMNLWNDKKCNKYREDYYFDEDTPIRGTIKKDAYGAAETMHRANIDTRMREQFGSFCEKLMVVLLPRAYMPKTKDLYNAHSKKVCAELKTLKSCLTEVTSIDDNVGAKRRIYGNDEADKNSVLDKFQTQEAIKR